MFFYKRYVNPYKGSCIYQLLNVIEKINSDFYFGGRDQIHQDIAIQIYFYMHIVKIWFLSHHYAPKKKKANKQMN